LITIVLKFISQRLSTGRGVPRVHSYIIIFCFVRRGGGCILLIFWHIRGGGVYSTVLWFATLRLSFRPNRSCTWCATYNYSCSARGRYRADIIYRPVHSPPYRTQFTRSVSFDSRPNRHRPGTPLNNNNFHSNVYYILWIYMCVCVCVCAEKKISNKIK